MPADEPAAGERPTLAELTANLRPIPLFCAFMTPTEAWSADREAMMTVLVDHVLWLKDLEARGILFASGPLGIENWSGEGMSIIRSASLEEAEAVFAAEPFAVAGLRTNRVRSWLLNEGSMTIRIDLLGRDFTFP